VALGDVALTSATDLPNYHTVEENLYRGGRPSDAGLKWLADQGVKTILDLENENKAIAHERTVATGLGMRFLSEPMSGFWTPEKATVDAAVADLDDASLYPLYVHCEHGEDRTGLIVGLFRVFDQKWAPAAAYQEMRQLGFHPELFLLNHYFERATGYED
jgi:protein tyrosine/serine phosphatase